MTIGMSVNVPKTKKEHEAIQRLIVALETAASFSREVELWFQGQPASEVLSQLVKQLQKFQKEC